MAPTMPSGHLGARPSAIIAQGSLPSARRASRAQCRPARNSAILSLVAFFTRTHSSGYRADALEKSTNSAPRTLSANNDCTDFRSCMKKSDQNLRNYRVLYNTVIGVGTRNHSFHVFRSPGRVTVFFNLNSSKLTVATNATELSVPVVSITCLWNRNASPLLQLCINSKPLSCGAWMTYAIFRMQYRRACLWSTF